MTISKELLDELLSGVERPEDLLGDKGLPWRTSLVHHIGQTLTAWDYPQRESWAFRSEVRYRLDPGTGQACFAQPIRVEGTFGEKLVAGEALDQCGGTSQVMRLTGQRGGSRSGFARARPSEP